jgi:nucleoside-diphosphate-sugar epimerase
LNILITGASGYLGSSLINKLSGLDTCNIYALSRTEPIKTYSSNIHFIHTDLSNIAWISHLPQQIDIVVYLAQSVKYRLFPEGAVDMMRINTQCVFELLEWSRINKVKKFIYASTGNVYKSSGNTLYESDPLFPASFYTASKINAENVVQQYSTFFETIILRIFSIYGPGQKNMLIPSVIERIKAGELITLAHNKGIILSPVYISDAVQMLERIIFNTIKPGVYNFAGRENVSLAELVKIAEAVLKVKAMMKSIINPV